MYEVSKSYHKTTHLAIHFNLMRLIGIKSPGGAVGCNMCLCLFL